MIIDLTFRVDLRTAGLAQANPDKHVAIIAVDFAGVRNGKEHTPTDQLCADRGTFIE